MKIDSLFHNRDSAAACCDYYLPRIYKCADCFKLYNFLRFRSCQDSFVSAVSQFSDKVSLAFFSFSLFFCKDTSDDLLRFSESIIIWINDNLCKDSSYRFINTAGNKFCADRGLEVISDIALTHCRTYGHRCKCIVRMCFAKFIHGCVDHSNLWTVTVGNDYTISGFYKICDSFGCFFCSDFLLR